MASGGGVRDAGKPKPRRQRIRLIDHDLPEQLLRGVEIFFLRRGDAGFQPRRAEPGRQLFVVRVPLGGVPEVLQRVERVFRQGRQPDPGVGIVRVDREGLVEQVRRGHLVAGLGRGDPVLDHLADVGDIGRHRSTSFCWTAQNRPRGG